MKLNDKILYCRKKQGLSQEALAEKLGVSRQAVSKWETGDAVPEIGKLLSLAQNFGVTTDWLLSEEEPEEVKANCEGFESASRGSEAFYEQTAESDFTGKADDSGIYRGTVNWSSETSENTSNKTGRNTDWMDELPGFLGKLVRKFGWLAGVYIAVSGAGVTMVGLIALIFSSLMVTGIHGATERIPVSTQSMTVYDDKGNIIYDVDYEELFGAAWSAVPDRDMNASSDYYIGSGDVVDYYINPVGSFSASNVTVTNPVAILPGFMIVIGVLMMIAGTVFAVVWRKKSLEQAA